MITRLPAVAFVLAALATFGMSTTAFTVAPRAHAGAPAELTPIAESATTLPDSAVEPRSPRPRELPLESSPSAPAPNPSPSPAATGQPVARAALVLHVPVLMYHYIAVVPATQATDRFAVDLRVPPDLFEQHLAYLRAQGYGTISTPALWDALNGRATLPAKPIVLTFDDGYADAYSNAFPLLRKYGFIGTFFVTCNLVGRPGYMTWDQVRELDAAGMDIESHAMDHKAMSAFNLGGLAYEMGQARATLGQQLGHEVRFFAYPSGDFNATALQGVAANGYFAAFLKAGGSSQSVDWRYTLRRTRVTGYASLETFKVALGY